MTLHDASCCTGHADLDRRFVELVRRAKTGDWHDLEHAWRAFARDLIAHMEYEEVQLFDEFARESSRNAALVRELEADHRIVRRRLDALTEQMQVKLVETTILDAFMVELRDHARREDEALYLWREQRHGTPARERRTHLDRRPAPTVGPR